MTTVSDISSKGEFEEAVNKLSQDLLIVGLFKQHKQLLTFAKFECASCQVVTTSGGFFEALLCVHFCLMNLLMIYQTDL